eukprot:GFUD01032341.1.p1 GENE.GFUD01032341.1~~GFUD01032341.1.p1  ORF type:complete len:113 (+),score=47.92 GFUD01032341.1:96-434(+)
MTFSYIQEMSLYRQLAAAIGGSLEDVCNLQEKERQEMISVMGLVVEEEKYLLNYLVDSPGQEKGKYRTRTVARMEEVVDTKKNSSLGLGGVDDSDIVGQSGVKSEIVGQKGV